jgi:hypothetical protein
MQFVRTSVVCCQGVEQDSTETSGEEKAMDEKRRYDLSVLTDRRQEVLRVLLLLTLGFLALSLLVAALPSYVWAAEDASSGGRASAASEEGGDEATWSNTPPAIIKASEDEEGGSTWSETPPTIITADVDDGESSWSNSPPEIVALSTAEYDLTWNRTVPLEAVAR